MTTNFVEIRNSIEFKGILEKGKDEFGNTILIIKIHKDSLHLRIEDRANSKI